MRRLKGLAGSMFVMDWFFLLLLVGLMILPFLSVHPKFYRFPFKLFFSALGSASVVILAWERIANSRGAQLRLLMERVYYSDEKGKGYLYKALRSIFIATKKRKRIQDEDAKNVRRAASILEQSGSFHGVAYLYPKKTLGELHNLSHWIDEYNKDREDFEEHIKGFKGGKFKDLDRLIIEVIEGEVEMRLEGESYKPYGKGSGEPLRKFHALDRKEKGEFDELVKELKGESNFVRELGTWSKEILERADQIRDDFSNFLIKHCVELPPNYDEDWEAASLIEDYTEEF